MINQQVLEGNWNEVKGKLRQKWGKLSESDVTSFRGNVDELVGTIQRKTGEGREAVERYLQEITESGGSTLGQATEAARQYMGQAGDTIRESASQAANQLYQTLEGTRAMLRERPGQTLAVCFGAGLVVGLVIALSFRSR